MSAAEGGALHRRHRDDERATQAPVDDRLVVRAQAGDLKAFEELVVRHQGEVYRLARRMLRDPHDAEDAAQETFVQAWRRLDGFRGDAAFRTWLHRVTVNACLQALRSRPPTEPLPEEVVATGPRPEQMAEAGELVEATRAAVATLTGSQRAVWVLRELEGMSYEAIGEALGVSLPSVRSRLHRARVQVVTVLRLAGVEVAGAPVEPEEAAPGGEDARREDGT